EQRQAGLAPEHGAEPSIEAEPPGVVRAPRRDDDRLLEMVRVDEALGEAVRREQEPFDASGIGGRLTCLCQPLDGLAAGADGAEGGARDAERPDLDRPLPAGTGRIDGLAAELDRQAESAAPELHHR